MSERGDTLIVEKVAVPGDIYITTFIRKGSIAVQHLADNGVVRPAYQIVEWIGSVEPLNMIDGDIWNKTT